MKVTKEQFTKFLESATEAQLGAIAAIIEGKENPAVKAAADAQAALKTAQDAQAKAEADLKAATEAQPQAIEAAVKAAMEAPEVVAALALAGERKTSSIKALMDTKRCDKTEEQLKALSQAELDSMIKLAGSKPVDYSGQAARGVEQENTVPAAPDTVAAIKAANAKR